MSATLSSSANAVRRFWDRYLELLHKQGVKPPADRWYVIRAEAYIKANPERHLVEHTPDDIHRYLSDLGGIGRINDWQFRQSVDAIQIMVRTGGCAVRPGDGGWEPGDGDQSAGNLICRPP